MAEGSWYKLSDNNRENKEIMIVGNERKAYPLSKNSSIVKNMKEVKQIRIYVKPADREKVDTLLK